MGSTPGLTLGARAAALQHALEAVWVQTPMQQYYILPLYLFRGVQRAGLEALLLQAGEDAGMRQAELRGYLQGLQSLAWMLGNPIYAAFYAKCAAAKDSRRFYLLL